MHCPLAIHRNTHVSRILKRIASNFKCALTHLQRKTNVDRCSIKMVRNAHAKSYMELPNSQRLPCVPHRGRAATTGVLTACLKTRSL